MSKAWIIAVISIRRDKSFSMKKIISTDLTPSNIAKVMEILTETLQKLETLSKPLMVEQLRQPLGQGERSLTQDLAQYAQW